MNILGLDYGEKKIGLAIGDTLSKFAEPLEVVRYKKLEQVMERVKQIALVERVEKVVIGLSEGNTADKTKGFGFKLARYLKLPILYFDETLSTKEAQDLSIQSGMKRKKRKTMEDAFAASLMLQNYLEEN
jgi:putative holliday junction resolvase